MNAKKIVVKSPAICMRNPLCRRFRRHRIMFADIIVGFAMRTDIHILCCSIDSLGNSSELDVFTLSSAGEYNIVHEQRDDHAVPMSEFADTLCQARSQHVFESVGTILQTCVLNGALEFMAVPLWGRFAPFDLVLYGSVLCWISLRRIQRCYLQSWV
jgi:hypothetical protein